MNHFAFAPLALIPFLIALSALAQPCPSGMVPTGVGTCIDVYEYPNSRGALPANGMSALPETHLGVRPGVWDAEGLCRAEGKRTCTLTEWKAACRGATAPPAVKYRAIHDEQSVAHRHPGVLEALQMAPPSGSHPKTAADSGAQDMRGSLEEWVRCEAGRDGWCLAGGHAAVPRTCDSPIIGHSGRWHLHTTGLRCCSDGAVMTPPSSTDVIEAMTLAISAEYAGVRRDKKMLAGFRRLSGYYRETGVQGALIDPIVDMFFLAANGHFESRNQPRIGDGDKEIGGSVGPQQVSTAGVTYLPRISEGWQGITLRELRDPRTNVQAAYAVLDHWRTSCRVKSIGSGDVWVPARPGAWFTAYRRGKCPTLEGNRMRRQIGSGGVRRCALLTAMLRWAGQLPRDWKCGHEGRRLSPKTRAFVAALTIAAPPRPTKPAPGSRATPQKLARESAATAAPSALTKR